MRILQLVSNLGLGGAERVAVNIANGLHERAIHCDVCVSRFDGALHKVLHQDINVTIFPRRSSFEILPVLRLVKCIRNGKYDIIHAHTSSIFLALLSKLFSRSKVVWHDHEGDSEFLHLRKPFALRAVSHWIDYVFAVNEKLKRWATSYLRMSASRVSYIPNYPAIRMHPSGAPPVEMEDGDFKYIVCVANYRKQKDLMMLLKGFRQAHSKYPQSKLLLIGIDFEDGYSRQMRDIIGQSELTDHAVLLGSRDNVQDYLAHAYMGVLSSESEGFPVSLLEYGLMKLPVIVTKVGQCPEIVDDGRAGILVPAGDYEKMAQDMINLLENPADARMLGERLYARIMERYSEEVVMKQIIAAYRDLLRKTVEAG